MKAKKEIRRRGKERRHEFRRMSTFPADIFRVNQLTFRNKWDHEVGVNIGMDGLCIKSAKALPENASITVAVLLHNSNAELVEVDAKLLWTQRRIEGQGKIYYMGLQFTRLTTDAKEKIQRFVDEGKP